MTLKAREVKAVTEEKLVAENETLTLDGRTASRWDPVRGRIRSGESPAECFDDIEEKFYQSLRGACRLMQRGGVTLERLLTAALEGTDELEALVRQTRRQKHAQLLLDVVRCQAFLSLEPLVTAWLWAIWDSIRDMLEIDLSRHGDNAAFGERVAAMVNRLARLIARKPSRIPPRPRRPGRKRPDDLDDTLGRSIL